MFHFLPIAYLAGLASLLAPCVLPLLPMVLNSAISRTSWGPALNALGMTVSFTAFGLLTLSFSSLMDHEILKRIGGLVMTLSGLWILLPAAKNFLSRHTSRLVSSVNTVRTGILNRPSISPWILQFLNGAILGMIWSPCSGPTLGMTVGLASQTGKSMEAGAIFLAFGLGAGSGLLGFGFLMKRVASARGVFQRLEKWVSPILGGLAIVLGVWIMTGLDQKIESVLTRAMPDWLLRFVTRW